MVQKKAMGGLLLAVLLAALSLVIPAQAGPQPQVPTGSIPTVTGTPVDVMLLVLGDGSSDYVKVRAGPGTTNYEEIGVLFVGQQVPAVGRTSVGDWVQIAYAGVSGGVGWVYAPFVKTTGYLPVVAPPATRTPQVTPTIDPTLASQFLIDIQPTRQPTYTAPPPVSIPTFTANNEMSGTGSVPMGFVIVGLGVIGAFGTLISLLRGR